MEAELLEADLFARRFAELFEAELFARLFAELSEAEPFEARAFCKSFLQRLSEAEAF